MLVCVFSALLAVAPVESTAMPAAPQTEVIDAGVDEAVDVDELGLDEPAAADGDGEAEAIDAGLHYSTDISDAELARRLSDDPTSLGSLSIGVSSSGRLVNGVQMPLDDDAWFVADPPNTFGTEETITYLSAAARAVREAHPGCSPLRVGHIGKREGGYLPPHLTHQMGRDVDLGFYYPPELDIRVIAKKRELAMDVAVNWTLVKSLLIHGDVQAILVDQRVQKVLYDHALSIGEDKTWLDSLFRAGTASIIHHARRHRDHFHVRYYSPRSQELGRRVMPLLAKQAQEHVVLHRVKAGDTLGGIAYQYGSSSKAIAAVNGLKGTMIMLGRTIRVPLRGPCTQCPIPPALVVPPRRLPPERPVAGT
jgi:murein endopeptidase